MSIILISTDRKIVEKGSAVQNRMLEYAELFSHVHVIVFCTSSQGFAPYISLSPKLSVYMTCSKNKWRYVFDAIWLARNVLKIDTTIQYTISTQDPFETGVVGWWLALRNEVRWQAQVHTDVFSPYFRASSVLNKIRVAIARYILPQAHSIRVVAERIKDSLMKEIPLQRTPIVLPIWTDITKIENTCPLFYLHQKYPEYEYIMITVARLEKEKDIGLTLQALQHVRRVFPKTGFVIIGEGKEKESLMKEIVELGLQDNVRFEGFKSDVIPYYKTADVYVCTSLYEGFGLSLYEAAASECPIVTTDVGLVGSILKKDIDVIVCDRSDTEIAEAIMEIFSDEERRNALRTHAHQSVSEHSSTKAQYLRQYKKSLE